jgi:dUTP pyrophosphatase
MFEKLTDNAVIPTRATKGSCGYDLVATGHEWSDSGDQITYRTGIRLKDIPEGYFAQLVARSSVVKTDLRLANGVGVIDPDYEGEILVVFDAPRVMSMVISKGNAKIYQVGEKVAQLVILPYLIAEDSVTAERGTGGFGSSGKKPKKGSSNGSEDV